MQFCGLGLFAQLWTLTHRTWPWPSLLPRHRILPVEFDLNFRKPAVCELKISVCSALPYQVVLLFSSLGTTCSTYDSAIPPLRVYPKEAKSALISGLQSYIYRSKIHNSLTLKQPRYSSVKKLVHLLHKVLLRHSTICNKWVQTKDIYAQWNQPIPKGQS